MPEPMFTPEGERLSGQLSIQPGEGLLLLSKAPVAPEAPREDFESPDPPFASWRWAEVRTENGGNRYLHLTRSPGGQEQEHDISLEPVRSLEERPRLRLRLRTTDPEAKLLARIEVDDIGKQYEHAVLEASPQYASNYDPLSRGAADIPYRSSYGVQVPYISTDAAMQSDGQWHTLVIDAERFLEGSRYSFRRWDHIRLIGSVDVDDIEVLEEA
jgi:hypothetical protein